MIERKLRIGFDVDGVLACFYGAYEDLTVEVSGEDKFLVRYPTQLPQCWNWPESYGYSKEVMGEVWRRIKANPDFWFKLPRLASADEFIAIQKLISNFHDVYFITDRPSPGAKWATESWLNQFGVCPPTTLISKKGKGICCDALQLDYYLDDKTENIEDVMITSTTQGYIIDRPYNQECKAGKRVGSVMEFIEEVLG